MLLKDKVVLVTGVGVGLGREVAVSALEQGAQVIVAARSADKLAATAAELDPTGERVAAIPADLGDEESCAALATAAVERFGRIDALVQVAAYEGTFGGLHETNLDEWKMAWDVNVLGAMRLLRAVVPVMKDAGGGAVVLIGSQSSYKPSLPQAGYAATKAGLRTMSYYLSDEFGGDNVRFNNVVPSWMWGPNVEMFVDYRAQTENKTQQEVLDEITGSFAMKRMTEDREVADAAMFFCSDLARGVTGQSLLVNCGEMME
jgi:NAD(P)-dependent dehydrogenase (short-subunit alcohol dehydrogenase family)